jgi:hypothetical protein
MDSVFEATEIMSPYHLSVVVSDFINRNNTAYKEDNEIIHRLLIPSDMEEQADLVMNFSMKALKELEKFTSFLYEYDMMSSVMIPSEEGASGNV